MCVIIGKYCHLLFLLLASNITMAAIIPVLDYDKMIADSDVICVGTVIAVSELEQVNYPGYSTVRLKEASLVCVRNLKNNKANEQATLNNGKRLLRVQFYDSDEILIPTIVFRPGGSGLYFLKEQPSGRGYRLTDDYHGKQPASLIPYNGFEQSYTKHNNSAVRNSIENEYLHAVKTGDQTTVLDALNQLYVLDSYKLPAEMDSLLKSPLNQSLREGVKGTALALQIKHNDFDALNEIDSFLASFEDKSSFSQWQHQLLSAISQISQSEAAEKLSQWLLHKNLALRQSASYALRGIADENELLMLLSGVEDSDLEVSYNCFVAICKIGEIECPGREEFSLEKPAQINRVLEKLHHLL